MWWQRECHPPPSDFLTLENLASCNHLAPSKACSYLSPLVRPT